MIKSQQKGATNLHPNNKLPLMNKKWIWQLKISKTKLC